MLRLLVSPQIHFPLEAFSAEITAEWFESRVFPAVCDQVGALTEGLPTHLALVWFFSCSANDMEQLDAFMAGVDRRCLAAHLCE